jgi:voltage-gated potassium channel
MNPALNANATPLKRLRRGAILLVSTVVLATIGYRFLGYSWTEAFWMVVITISSVGYGERSSGSPAVMWLSMGVIFVGMSCAAYTLGGFIQLLFAGEIERHLGVRRVNKEIEQLRDHVIVCGYGRVGELLAGRLRRMNVSCVIIDSDPTRIELARSRQLIALVGDATAEETLNSGGLERAKTLVTSLPSDAENVFITLTARQSNSKVNIIARAEHPSSEKKLRQAGANRVVMPTVVGASQMARLVTRPATAAVMDLLGETTYEELELDEVVVESTSPLSGHTLGECQSLLQQRIMVVAVHPPEGRLMFNPLPTQVIHANDILVVMGHSQDIAKLKTKLRLSESSD